MTFSGMLKQIYCKRNTQHVYTTGRKPSAFPVSSGGGITPSECIAGFRPSCQRKERPALVEIPRSRCSLRMLFSCCPSSFRFIMSGGLEEGSGSHEPRSCLNSIQRYSLLHLLLLQLLVHCRGSSRFKSKHVPFNKRLCAHIAIEPLKPLQMLNCSSFPPLLAKSPQVHLMLSESLEHHFHQTLADRCRPHRASPNPDFTHRCHRCCRHIRSKTVDMVAL